MTFIPLRPDPTPPNLDGHLSDPPDLPSPPDLPVTPWLTDPPGSGSHPPCPQATPPETPTGTPGPLALSITLPATSASCTLARSAARALLRLHELDEGELAFPAFLAVTELTATAIRFTPHADVYLSLRQHDGALRVVAYDGHPHHPSRHLAEACGQRRAASLRTLAACIEAYGGSWGYGAAHEPHGGTRMWAVLPLPT